MQFEDTHPMTVPWQDSPHDAWLDTDVVGDGAAQAGRWSIDFTGSGSEYFRIWIVNVLLILVTLGLYLPWAKARRLRYFYGNTLVDNTPLDFHGDPKKMLRGTILVALLFGLYSWAGRFSITAGLVALVAIAALAPALLRSAMQFRLANTSWRGLRFRFTGSMQEVYRRVLPLYLPIVAVVALNQIVHHTQLHPDELQPSPSLMYAVGVAAMIFAALQPWTLWGLKAFQHNHYALGEERTTFDASLGAFYKLAFKALLFMVAIGVVAALLFVGGAFVLGKAAHLGESADSGFRVSKIAPIFIGLLVMYLTVGSGIWSYVTSRLQNLVWSSTRSDNLQFASELRFKSLLWLTLKNTVLVMLTLGLYWPFARVALARMRLQAMSVVSGINAQQLGSQAKGIQGDAAGDAAGDFFGIDIGF